MFSCGPLQTRNILIYNMADRISRCRPKKYSQKNFQSDKFFYVCFARNHYPHSERQSLWQSSFTIFFCFLLSHIYHCWLFTIDFFSPFLPFINGTIFQLHSFDLQSSLPIGQCDQWPFSACKMNTRISITKWHFFQAKRYWSSLKCF